MAALNELGHRVLGAAAPYVTEIGLYVKTVTSTTGLTEGARYIWGLPTVVPPSTLFSINPADNASLVGTTVTITPPAGMQAGDLVLVHALWRDSAALNPSWPSTPPTTGGQTWSQFAPTNNSWFVSSQRYMCEFNGTWAANPVFGPTGVSADTISGAMFVFRPSSVGRSWVLDTQAYFVYANWGTGGPGGPAPYDMGYVMPAASHANTVYLMEWHRNVAQTFALQTPDWTNPNGETQWRNIGSGGSGGMTLSAAYKIVGTTITGPGNPTNRADAGPWYGVGSHEAFYEQQTGSTVSGTVSRIIVKSQAKQRKSRW